VRSHAPADAPECLSSRPPRGCMATKPSLHRLAANLGHAQAGEREAMQVGKLTGQSLDRDHDAGGEIGLGGLGADALRGRLSAVRRSACAICSRSAAGYPGGRRFGRCSVLGRRRARSGRAERLDTVTYISAPWFPARLAPQCGDGSRTDSSSARSLHRRMGVGPSMRQSAALRQKYTSSYLWNRVLS